MSLFDIYIINNYGEPVRGFDWWKLSGIFGVCVGFGLSYFHKRFEKNEDINEAGETFENQLKAFKDPIKRQAIDLKNYEYKVFHNEYGVVTVYLKHRFELIKSLD